MMVAVDQSRSKLLIGFSYNMLSELRGTKQACLLLVDKVRGESNALHVEAMQVRITSREHVSVEVRQMGPHLRCRVELELIVGV